MKGHLTSFAIAAAIACARLAQTRGGGSRLPPACTATRC